MIAKAISPFFVFLSPKKERKKGKKTKNGQWKLTTLLKTVQTGLEEEKEEVKTFFSKKKREKKKKKKNTNYTISKILWDSSDPSQ